MNAIEAVGVAKRYRSDWVLADCSLAIPDGRIVALVGPNGAGKTTLLHCAVGLTSPTRGTMTILDGLAPGSPEALAAVSFVAQDAPLHRHLSVASMIAVAMKLNPGFDSGEARHRLGAQQIPLDRKVRHLSGGQQAQVALTLALARHPRLLILDEPLARLDPLARHELMAQVMESALEESISVIFSSHVISELERVADYLVVLGRSRVQIAGDIETLCGEHAVLTGPANALDDLRAKHRVVHAECADRQAHVLVRLVEANLPLRGWERSAVSLEELVLSYLRAPGATHDSGRIRIAASSAGGVS